MRPEVLYSTYPTSYHEQTEDIITFAQFEKGNLLENERNLVENKPISDSIAELSAEDSFDYESISKNALK